MRFTTATGAMREGGPTATKSATTTATIIVTTRSDILRALLQRVDVRGARFLEIVGAVALVA